MQKFMETGALRINCKSCSYYIMDTNKWTQDNTVQNVSYSFPYLSLIITPEIGIIAIVSTYIRGT